MINDLSNGDTVTIVRGTALVYKRIEIKMNGLNRNQVEWITFFYKKTPFFCLLNIFNVSVVHFQIKHEQS